MYALAGSAAFAPVDQHYLLQARQMQALSFAVHIPLAAHTAVIVCLIGFVLSGFCTIAIPGLDEQAVFRSAER